MVNEGWDFNTLMDMQEGEFAFWAREQLRHNEAVAKAAEAKRQKARG